MLKFDESVSLGSELSMKNVKQTKKLKWRHCYAIAICVFLTNSCATQKALYSQVFGAKKTANEENFRPINADGAMIAKRPAYRIFAEKTLTLQARMPFRSMSTSLSKHGSMTGGCFSMPRYLRPSSAMISMIRSSTSR